MKTLHSIPADASRIAIQPLPGSSRFARVDLWLSYADVNDCTNDFNACGEPTRHTGSVPLL